MLDGFPQTTLYGILDTTATSTKALRNDTKMLTLAFLPVDSQHHARGLNNRTKAWAPDTGRKDPSNLPFGHHKPTLLASALISEFGF